jgi:hypothetical protein
MFNFKFSSITYKNFQLSPTCMQRISYVSVGSQTWAQTLDVFIPFTISNTTAYYTVVKSLKINVIFNTYKIFLLSLIYMRLISYV